MNPPTPRKPGRTALWFVPIVAVPAAVLVSLPWLRQQEQGVVFAVVGVAAAFVLLYSFVLAARMNRRLDEVEIAGQRFAQTQGMTIGWTVAVLATLFPPSMDALVGLAQSFSGSPENAVRLGIVLGLMLVVVLQTLVMFAAAIWWARRVVGPQS
jgi:hypothetical protein